MKTITAVLFLSLVSVVLFCRGEDNIYKITDFDIDQNGTSLNTVAIQKAINQAHTDGGGVIVFPEGTYLTGSIVLKSNVSLRLEKGATILGSSNRMDYTGLNRWLALILADGQTNIGISGEGTIDGQGLELALHTDSLYHAGVIEDPNYSVRLSRPSEYQRPQIIEMVNCKNVNITGVNIKDAACWVQTYDRCQNLFIDRINVYSDAYWNNDGLDISDCKNVRITNCIVNSADDGICLKSHSPSHFNDSIYIGNCIVRSSASAVKFGTASSGGFKNVKIEHIKVYDTFRSAIAIESVDGGFLENIDISDIEAENTGNAIFIRLGKRNKNGEAGSLSNIKIRDIIVQIARERPDKDYIIRGPALPFFHNPFPSSITGIPGAQVKNVSIENVEITFSDNAHKGYAYLPVTRLSDVPEKITNYPEFSMFGELPAWGFYVRHVDGLSLKNIKLIMTGKDFRPAWVFDDVLDLKLESPVIQGYGNQAQIILRNVSDKDIDRQTKEYGFRIVD